MPLQNRVDSTRFGTLRLHGVGAAKRCEFAHYHAMWPQKKRNHGTGKRTENARKKK